MAEITAALVKQLRDKTGAGMMDAKKALVENKGDIEASADWLREKGILKAAKKADRVAAEGLIGVVSNGKAAALVEVNSETDFVARNEGFQKAVREIANVALANNGDVMKVAHAAASTGGTVNEMLQSLVATIGELGALLRRVHALPLPDGAIAGREPRAFLDEVWTGLRGFPLPAWTGDVVRRVLDEPPPPADRAPVLSHNDPNPSNLVHDGARLRLLDWDSAGANDPFVDLAAVAVFLRLDDAACARLIAAHDDAPVAASLPASFVYLRRAIAALCGALFLQVARASGHAGARGDETFARAPTLGDVYGAMGAGTLSARSPDGQWAFGQALLKASAQL